VFTIVSGTFLFEQSPRYSFFLESYFWDPYRFLWISPSPILVLGLWLTGSLQRAVRTPFAWPESLFPPPPLAFKVFYQPPHPWRGHPLSQKAPAAWNFFFNPFLPNPDFGVTPFPSNAQFSKVIAGFPFSTSRSPARPGFSSFKALSSPGGFSKRLPMAFVWAEHSALFWRISFFGPTFYHHYLALLSPGAGRQEVPPPLKLPLIVEVVFSGNILRSLFISAGLAHRTLRNVPLEKT